MARGARARRPELSLQNSPGAQPVMADIDVQDQPAEAGAGADDHAEVRRARASLEE